jgi:hypothetical protein
MISNEIRDLAQKLLENTIEIKELEENTKVLRYQLVGDARLSPIECDGGIVYFREAQERYSLDRDILRRKLKSDHKLSDLQIDRLLEDSKNMNLILPTVFVKVD